MASDGGSVRSRRSMILQAVSRDAHIAIRFYIARTYTQPELSSRRNYSLASIFCTTLIWEEAVFEHLSLGRYVIKLSPFCIIAPALPCAACSASPIAGTTSRLLHFAGAPRVRRSSQEHPSLPRRLEK